MAKKGQETAKKGHATPKQVNLQKSSRKRQIKKKVQEVRDKKSSMIKWAGICRTSSALTCYCAEYTVSRRKSILTNTAFLMKCKIRETDVLLRMFRVVKIV